MTRYDDEDNGDEIRRLFVDLVMPTPRECLITALAKAMPDGDKHARDLVDALDAYLAEDAEGRLPPPFLIPKGGQETLLRRDLDAALARAEKAEQALAATKTTPAKRAKTKRLIR